MSAVDSTTLSSMEMTFPEDRKLSEVAQGLEEFPLRRTCSQEGAEVSRQKRANSEELLWSAPAGKRTLSLMSWSLLQDRHRTRLLATLSQHHSQVARGHTTHNMHTLTGYTGDMSLRNRGAVQPHPNKISFSLENFNKCY